VLAVAAHEDGDQEVLAVDFDAYSEHDASLIFFTRFVADKEAFILLKLFKIF
uniref:Uncharacterized protein n=1 Tax=Oryza brachyantha TaxID=4533 RepID=J3LPQ0_ORYBR